eukprot:m.1655893 g.1655893  ORF g.1655893 m.1655893 type:complete len:52 (-) comp105740_c0_seq1:146-301(-)
MPIEEEQETCHVITTCAWHHVHVLLLFKLYSLTASRIVTKYMIIMIVISAG